MKNKFHLIYFLLDKKTTKTIRRISFKKNRIAYSEKHNNRIYKTKTYNKVATPFLKINDYE